MTAEETVVQFRPKAGGNDGGPPTLSDLIGGLNDDMVGIGAEVAQLSWNGQAPDWQALEAAMASLQQRLALIRELMSDGAA